MGTSSTVRRVLVLEDHEFQREVASTTSVLAKGVETQEDWDILRDLGCDQAQGYFIAKPMPGDAFMHWHERWMSA